jgi:hypoxanthine-guanine phosphoribosyltransferase
MDVSTMWNFYDDDAVDHEHISSFDDDAVDHEHYMTSLDTEPFVIIITDSKDSGHGSSWVVNKVTVNKDKEDRSVTFDTLLNKPSCRDLIYGYTLNLSVCLSVCLSVWMSVFQNKQVFRRL